MQSLRDRLAALNPSPATRRYIYRVAVALGLVAVGYGLVTEHEVVLWLGLGNAALGGIADANVRPWTLDDPPAR